ncbi:endonuclease domain-containing protein, partial [Enterococcus faecalis]|uniref:endonuclease domain-containing protein n=1 Tax=Enterococcus faecalis TaxID=1351 RepID=UPI003D6A8ADD
QALIGPFIADFASRRAKIVIELDGGQHAENAADMHRTRQIEERGYRVLRFWNHDVLSNIEGVLAVIQNALTPTPDPSPQGGGIKTHAARVSPARTALDTRSLASVTPSAARRTIVCAIFALVAGVRFSSA